MSENDADRLSKIIEEINAGEPKDPFVLKRVVAVGDLVWLIGMARAAIDRHVALDAIERRVHEPAAGDCPTCGAVANILKRP